mmetsp:Transcript_20755/g.40346  ORF Transcript_20755/g.40346 Transcript_20755/m.40346 type:complete len:191 (+) Transcript_20755:87-659(+)
MQSPGGGGQSENGASVIVQNGAYAPFSPAAAGSKGGATAATPPTERRAKRKREASPDSSEMPPLLESKKITAAKAVEEYLRLQVHPRPVSKEKIFTKWGVSQGSFNRALERAQDTGAADAIKREEQSILAARAISEGGGRAKKVSGRKKKVAPEAFGLRQGDSRQEGPGRGGEASTQGEEGREEAAGWCH